MFFKDYELLNRSGLFDPAFYLATYPEVAALDMDPLVHYLEQGAALGHAPSAGFDPAHYAGQCRAIGEMPANALLHYLTVGASRGLKPRAEARAGRRIPERYIFIDSPSVVDGAAAATVVGKLGVTGWALARDGVASIEILVDGTPAATAHHGMRRPDVSTLVPEREDALCSGFACLIPHWRLTPGKHVVGISLRDKNGATETSEFRIEVAEAPQSEGAFALRRKIGQGEINLQMRILEGLAWQPRFWLVLALDADDAPSIASAALSLQSLAEQAYPHWRVLLLHRDRKLKSAALRKRLLSRYAELAGNVDVIAAATAPTFAQILARQPRGFGGFGREFFSPLTAGDELGVDALLEFALASGFRRDADFLYADERCVNPATGVPEPYFKPQWSPDLMLSTNYLGRQWCADSALCERAGARLQTWGKQGEYDLSLRLSECAQDIHHLARTLSQRGAAPPETDRRQRAALVSAAQRRGISATVEAGCAPGFYRFKRSAPARARVSIIIPTRAAQGRIKTCLESLRDVTAHRAFEIVCIENIPAGDRAAKQWLRKHADQVIETGEPFNWSRYNNLAAEKASSRYLLFLNDDVEIIQADWLSALLEHAARPEVGVVGPQLLYADRSVQHAGLALTASLGTARHIFRHAREDDPGYFGLALTQRNVIGVTGACLLTRRDTYEALGRFDESHGIINNDLDFCLKSWSSGRLNVYTPYAKLIHHELESRWNLGESYDEALFAGRWRELFRTGDPYLNPNLSREHDNLQAEQEPVRVVCASRPLIARAQVRRILIVKLDHIGDCVSSLPALQKLIQRFPEARFTVLAAPTTRTIWEMMTPRVAEFIPFEFFHARSGLGLKEVAEDDLLKLGRQLKPKRFDLAVDLRKSADTRYLLRHSGARWLAGFDFRAQFPWLDIALEWEGDTQFSPKRQRIGDDLLNLADAIEAACEPDRAALVPAAESLPKLAPAHRALFRKAVVCVHPAAGNEMRQWPVAYFAELIDLLIDKHEVNIALIGGADEHAPAQSLRSLIRQKSAVFNLAGKLPLAELPVVIARCALYVGNNSGPLHLASALEVPAVGIHPGVIDPREWGASGINTIAVRREVSCSPCYLEKREQCNRGLACLQMLSPTAVYAACRRMLAMRTSAALIDD